jgi:hypothetical protein
MVRSKRVTLRPAGLPAGRPMLLRSPHFRQFGGHHLGGAVRVSALAQHLRDNGRAAKVNLERLVEVELLPG